MRPIDADALKKDWSMANKCEECPQDARKCQYEQNFTRMDICEMLDEAPTVGGWISVKDRLPEKNGDYLIYNTDGIVWPYWYDKEYKEWYDSSGYLTESVTHWMPLPEAPKEGEA